MLGFPLSFYWLSGVKWIRMQDVKPQTLVETFDQANYNSIPEYNVALITLLTYPVSTCTAERSFSGMKRLPTPLWRTMTDERLRSLAILHIHKHKDVLNWYILLVFYKITKIVRALWLAERSVCMRVCKHGCGVKMFCFSRANHASANLKKFSICKQP